MIQVFLLMQSEKEFQSKCVDLLCFAHLRKMNPAFLNLEQDTLFR